MKHHALTERYAEFSNSIAWLNIPEELTNAMYAHGMQTYVSAIRIYEKSGIPLNKFKSDELEVIGTFSEMLRNIDDWNFNIPIKNLALKEFVNSTQICNPEAWENVYSARAAFSCFTYGFVTACDAMNRGVSIFDLQDEILNFKKNSAEILSKTEGYSDKLYKALKLTLKNIESIRE